MAKISRWGEQDEYHSPQGAMWGKQEMSELMVPVRLEPAMRSELETSVFSSWHDATSVIPGYLIWILTCQSFCLWVVGGDTQRETEEKKCKFPLSNLGTDLTFHQSSHKGTRLLPVIKQFVSCYRVTSPAWWFPRWPWGRNALFRLLSLLIVFWTGRWCPLI